ncbi:MAG TPA: DUF5684 domain-containing protein [Microthrixaceae bacterium]|nr:DUF5684 domain-containing protein [Microthrixaceae bacterium]
MLATLLQQYTTDFNTTSEVQLGGAFWVLMGIAALISIFYIAAMWKIFTKANFPGWHSIVPILNIYTLCRIAGRPGWWVILQFIPCVGTIVAIIVWMDIAKAFGKTELYGIGLVFLSPIFIPMLGFGSSQYWASGPRTSTYGGGPYGGGQFQGQPGFGGVGPGGHQQPGGFTPGAAMPAQPGLPGQSSAPGQSGPPPLPPMPGGGSPTPPPVPGWSSPGADIAPQPSAPTPAPAGPVAGWYPDPSGGAGLRWWDGTAWTDHKSE